MSYTANLAERSGHVKACKEESSFGDGLMRNLDQQEIHREMGPDHARSFTRRKTSITSQED